jgi:hypothetical protein
MGKTDDGSGAWCIWTRDHAVHVHVSSTRKQLQGRQIRVVVGGIPVTGTNQLPDPKFEPCDSEMLAKTAIKQEHLDAAARNHGAPQNWSLRLEPVADDETTES